MDYDIIGDIHGHAEKLTALLATMGYRDRMGAWRHADRQAIFVGDFIDRGPGQLETIRIVRGMLDAGSALAVMGNHEFNAIAWHTPDPDSDGDHLRRRKPKNLHQHKEFLAEAGSDTPAHADLVRWFYALPLWLDLPELRVVHACWHPGYMAKIESLLLPGRLLSPELVIAASRRERMEYRAIETLLKGVEIELPEGHAFHDKDENKRTNVRIRWWDTQADTYRKAAILEPPAARLALPDVPIPAEAAIGYSDSKPVFFGHYWCSGNPKPMSAHVACVDYSAGKGGPLVAYQWDGNPNLSAARFVSV